MTRAADLHFKQGLTYQNRGQHRMAVREYEAALEIEPAHLAARANLGIMLMVTGENSRAIEVLASVVESEPDCPDNLYNYGKALYKCSRISDALEAFIRAESLAPNDTLIIRSIADCHVALAHHEQALIKLQELTTLLPDDISARMSLGKAHLSAGNLGSARAAFQEALNIDQESAEAHLWLGEVLRKAEIYDDAIWHCQEAASLSLGWIDAYLGTARALRDAGNIDEAVEKINIALSYEPTNSEALALLREVKNPSEGVAHIPLNNGARSENNHEYLKSVDYIEKKARKLFALEDWDRAVDEFSRIVDIAPSRMAVLRLSQALVKKGDITGAVRRLRDMLKDHPEDIELGLELINLNLERNYLESALQDIQALVEVVGEEPRVLMLSAKVHLKAGDKAAAQECLQKLLALQPGNVDTYLALSEIAYTEGRIEDALRLWETALRYDPGRHEILFLISASHYRMQRFSRARETLKMYLDLYPEDIAARGLMAEILLKLKKVRAAKVEWHTMIEMAPGTPQDAVARARALLFLGHTSQARDALSLCMRAHGETASALFYSGVTDLIANDIPSAAENWARAWKLNRSQTEGALIFLKNYFNSEKIAFVADELSRVKASEELVNFIRNGN